MPRLAKVSLFGNAAKAAVVNLDATVGAQFGVNLLDPNGKLVPWPIVALAPSGGGALNTTDDLQEGQWNLWFTNRRAQDAVGSILADSANVTLTYVGGTTITGNLTAVTNAGGGTLQKTAFDAYGRMSGTSAATSDDLPEGTTNLYALPTVATAQTALTYPAVVAVKNGQAYYPDLTNPADVINIVGITLHAAALGAPVQIVTEREFTEPAWSWVPGPIFCALSGGGLTQTAPTTGAVIEVARAISATTIHVGIKPAFLRAA